MVCEKCGAQIEDGILNVYCKKCGHKLVQRDMEEKTEEDMEAGENVFRKKRYIAVLAGGMTLLIAVIAILVLSQGPEAFRSLSGTAASGNRIIEYKESTKEVTVTDQAVVRLEGTYPELTSINSNGGVILSGGFPQLQILTCSKVLESEKTDFSRESFPALTEVHLEIENAEVDEDFLAAMAGFQAMYERGELNTFTYEVSHTIEDLYGEWSDENGLLSLTIMEDGKIRVGAGEGILGAELFTYTEVDNNTLNMKVNAAGLVDLVSMQLDYELLGDDLTVYLLGTTYLMKRR